MSKEQALKILEEALASLRLTRQEHEILAKALRVATNTEKQIPKVD